MGGPPDLSERSPRLHYAIVAPNLGTYAEPRLVAGLAGEAEQAGWDGFFVWDHILADRSWRVDIADPWIVLAAIAAGTSRIRLGTLVTPLPRRRPWVVARQAVTLDHLSGGRLTLGMGLGYPPEAEFEAFGEDPDMRVRAEKLDEGLAILAGLWSGEPFAFEGRHYRLQEMTFLPRPVQLPRIPIWVAAVWPHRRPLARAARWDGVNPIRLPAGPGELELSPADLRELVAIVGSLRPAAAGPYDVVVGGETPGDDPHAARAIVARFAEAGATWWTESISDQRGPLDVMQRRIRQGPPGVTS